MLHLKVLEPFNGINDGLGIEDVDNRCLKHVSSRGLAVEIFATIGQVAVALDREMVGERATVSNR